MPLQSINPYTGEPLEQIETIDETALEAALDAAARAASAWGSRPVAERVQLLHEVAGLLRTRTRDLARWMTSEMGKLTGEAEAEIGKCALVCDYYAEHAERLLADVPIASDASRSMVVHQPLEDADLDEAAATAARSRFLNAGQSCIAAKRFIVVDAIAEAFVARLRTAIEALVPGDPLDPKTTLAPLARADLRDTLHEQVLASLDAGARLVLGGQPLDRPGWFYAATLLDAVGPGMPAYADELFGPVAAVLRAADEGEALEIANDTRFGLGGSVWTRDSARGERFARRMACGCAFVNGLAKSDPRLPFGGIKESGYGRELGASGIHEFVNAKTLWIR